MLLPIPLPHPPIVISRPQVQLQHSPVMRYDNWDVILFPKDSLVPIQEFRTACYVTQDEQGRQLSTLACYISSLPTSTPFRISIHSWATPVKPSPLIESRRKTNQRVVYTTQVIADGARVFHGFYEVASKWPQEIVKEKRSIADTHVQSSVRGSFLEFPPFHQNILMQSSWDARGDSGRVKVLLSEQLIRKTSSLGELDFGASNEIVCFAFQYVPREILEQAGISWPIRNPLYLPSRACNKGPPILQMSMPYTKARDIGIGSRVQSSFSQKPSPIVAGPQNPELLTQPRADPPQFSEFPKPTIGGRSLRNNAWDSSMVDTFGDNIDDMSMDSWSIRRTNSHSIADISMPDMNSASPLFEKSGDSWKVPDLQHGYDGDKRWMNGHPRQEKSSRQVVVALQQDQLSQLIEAISPRKKSQMRSTTNQHLAAQSIAQLLPPNMAATPITTRPSAAAQVRKASYPGLGSHPGVAANKPSCSNEDSRLPTAYPHANRVPTPHPFVGPQMSMWNSDVSMRDTSSVFSGLSQQQPAEDGVSPAPIASVDGKVKSKKEGMCLRTGQHQGHETCNNQGLLPRVDEQFVPGHKGMSSIDSTVRLERQLFSALGEELNSFNESTDPAPASTLDDIETPATKRKRQGTFGADRGRSPITKIVREELGPAQESPEADMPHLLED